MFRGINRLIKGFKPLIATSLLTLSYTVKKVAFDEPKKQIQQNINLSSIQQKDPHALLKKIIQKDICDSKKIRQGQLYIVQVQQQLQNKQQSRKLKIAITRIDKKLYAVIGHCTYKQPLTEQDIYKNSLQQAVIFNDKIYCPHHGCAFDAKSGSVQYGPALQNLSRFYVTQQKGRVKLFYPAKIPTSVQPQMQLRDFNDLRKVVILGGQNHATMGVIQGLKQNQYGGEISVIQNNGTMDYPYRQNLLHKHMVNLNKGKLFTNHKQSKIQKILQQKIYNKLKFYDDDWYQVFGIDFIFNNSPFRIINKKYFPFVKFADDSKVQFDGIVFATGFIPKLPPIRNITYLNKLQGWSVQTLPGNVFAPFYNKSQHLRLNKFLNKNQINKLMVFGMNVQSLQFIEGFIKQFPNKKVVVIDCNQQNTLTQLYGPDISRQIINGYIQKGVDFYVKLKDIPQFKNSYPLRKSYMSINANSFLSSYQQLSLPINPSNSISVKLDQKTILKTDCMVLFPNNNVANTDHIKQSKYVDLDFSKLNNRVIVDPNSRTDTKRMFGVGSCSSLQFFFTRNRIDILNHNASFEQGVTAAYNLNALNVPFNYIPFQKHSFLGKQVLYAGARKHFNSMFVLGDPKSWDFIAFYALQSQILAVSASPSRQKQFQVMRQAMRLQCQPQFQKLINGQWNIPKIYKLVRSLNKSGCYKDLIKTLDPVDNIPEVIWMQRNKRSGAPSDETQDDSNVQLDNRGYVKQL